MTLPHKRIGRQASDPWAALEMQCPYCKQQTITFRDWCAADNALRWLCPKCFAALRATLRTRLVLIGLLTMAVVILGFVILADQASWIPDRSGRVILAAALLLGLYPVGFLAFRFLAAYEVEAPPMRRQWPAGDEETRDADD